MCGRYTLTTPDIEAVARVVAAEVSPTVRAEHRPRFNVAPSQSAVIVCERAEAGESARRLEWAVWGLASPARAERRAGIQINVRAETAATAPALRDSFVSGRCGIVADGFYEWSGPKQRRQPHWFHRPNGGLVVFAGLYRDEPDEESGAVTRRFAILTTGANSTVAPHHERMPAIVPRGQLGRWLAPLPRTASMAEKTALAHILGPAPDDLLVATRASLRVGSPRFDDPACLQAEPTLLE